MGSTLTNTQPKDTYKSLLKTSDSSELSATAKYVSDGNGNDSALALSTSNVGIGTSSPNYSLQVNSSTTTTRLQITNSTTGTSAVNGLQIIQGGVNTTVSQKSNGFMSFETNNTERFRITANGVTFNGDTAAANALDDYEEGTFTATLKGGTTDPTTPVTTTANYTKIGRQATVNIRFSDVDLTGCTGDLYIAGLPFTAASGMISFTGTLSTHSVDFNGGTTAELHVSSGGTYAYLFSSLTNAAWRSMDSSSSGVYIQGTITYFV